MSGSKISQIYATIKHNNVSKEYNLLTFKIKQYQFLAAGKKCIYTKYTHAFVYIYTFMYMHFYMSLFRCAYRCIYAHIHLYFHITYLYKCIYIYKPLHVISPPESHQRKLYSKQTFLLKIDSVILLKQTKVWHSTGIHMSMFFHYIRKKYAYISVLKTAAFSLS